MSAGITIVGLGPGNPDLLTRAAWQRLSEAPKVFVRTKDHPGLEAIPFQGEVISFDDVYQQAESFEAVYETIVDRLLAEARTGAEVVYAVPGDPTVGEASTNLLRSAASEEEIPIDLIHGVSFIEPCLELLGLDALQGLVLVDALDLIYRYHPSFPPDKHVLISQIHSQLVASDVKLTLMNQYPASHPIVVLHEVGSSGISLDHLSLYQLDREDTFSSMSSLYLPPMEQGSSFEAFQELVAHLRSPEGCPWDREQTHLTLRKHMLEEAFEVLEALDSEDPEELKEELGDLMLQLVLQTQIAVEEDEFLMADVLKGIHDKLVRRHPHVFGEVAVEDVPEVLSNWEGLKAAERREGAGDKSALAGVPKTLPALAQAEEFQARAARLGFDWPQQSGVLDKIEEEMAEIAAAEGAQELEAEVGDLLFAVVNYARWLDVDPEAALRRANQRFRLRFQRVEHLAESSAVPMSEMDIDQLERLWQRAKEEMAQ